MSQIISDTAFVKCAICGLEAEMLSATHFKFKHNLTFAEYRQQYPKAPTMTLAKHLSRKKAISSKSKGRVAHNKGKSASIEQKSKQSATMKEKYSSGQITHWNEGNVWSEEVKNKISVSVSKYEFTSEQKTQIKQKKLIAKKLQIENGWISPLKNIPLTGEHLIKSQAAVRKASQVKSERSWQIIERKCNDYNLTINYIDKSDSNRLHLTCNTCSTQFTFQSQILRDSKRGRDGDICPTCFPRLTGSSQGEKELYNYILSLDSGAIANDKSALGSYGRELDVYIPSRKLAFEYDGLYYHSEQVHSITYNVKDKSTRAASVGIRLIHVFEDEWLNAQHIVKSRIKQIMGCNSTRLHARKLNIMPISASERDVFLSENHLQGKDTAKIRYGAYNGSELVAVMTIKPSNFVKGGDGTIMELSRFAVKCDHSISGIASRMFSRFVNDYPVDKVLSYADSRWSDGNLYKTLGFTYDGQTPPNYWYFLPNEGIRMHRSNFMKHNLVKSGSDGTKTEGEIMNNKGYFKIYDCGSSKWIWSRP